MTVLLALLLATIGTADAVRHLMASRSAELASAGAAAFAVAVLGCWGLGVAHHAWWIVPMLLAVVTAWAVLPDLAFPRARTWTLAGLVGVTLAVIALGQVTAERGFLHRWYDSLDIPALDGVGFDRFVLAVGCVVFLHTSANVVVRLVLAGSGPHVLESEQSLKGGRILGPVERWLIFGFALAGQLGAIAAIIAAKGIVRFPEISRADSSGNKAEYFLVGSFVSWFLAVLFIPLLK